MPNDHEVDAARARRALATAADAQHAGGAASARPAWYAPLLGLCMAVALGSFAIPSLTPTGIVVGAVIGPLVLEGSVRRATGATPFKDYFAEGQRGTVFAYLAGALILCMIGVVAAKLSEATTLVLGCALALGVLTAAAARHVGRVRSGAVRSSIRHSGPDA